MGKRSIAVANEIGVDVHLGHVVNIHRHLAAVAVAQDVIEERCFTCAEKPGKDGNRELTFHLFREASQSGERFEAKGLGRFRRVPTRQSRHQYTRPNGELGQTCYKHPADQ